jgi:hypothetical protein
VDSKERTEEDPIMLNRIFRKLLVNAIVKLIVTAFSPIPVVGTAIQIIAMAM